MTGINIQLKSTMLGQTCPEIALSPLQRVLVLDILTGEVSPALHVYFPILINNIKQH